MAERQRTEINAELLRAVRELAEEQGRPESALLEEAIAAYLSTRHREFSWGAIASGALGADVAGVATEGALTEAHRAPLPDLLRRMSSRFDLDEDEAMRVAVKEQHAFREERAERRKAEG